MTTKRRRSRAAPRDDRRTTELALDQVAAMLFFALPPAGRRRPRRPEYLRHQLDSAIRGLVHLAEGLTTGAFDETHCEGCGKPIGPGAWYATGEDGAFHRGCLGLSKEQCVRMPTRREASAELAARVAEARAYLKRRGFSV